MAGWNVVKEVGKYVTKKSGGSLARELGKEALKGAAAGAAEAVGDIVGTFQDSKTKKEISKNELRTQRDVERARLDQQKFNTTIQALSSVKSPAALLATVIGLANAPKKYRELSSQAIDQPK